MLEGRVVIVPMTVPTSIVAVGASPDAGAMLDTTVPAGIELPIALPEGWDAFGTVENELAMILLDI